VYLSGKAKVMADRQHLSLPFRPDIDGLRTVAVLLVVLCHYGVPGFAGGFIGVDIFFVISGFLITRLLVCEYEATGNLALMRFYSNRLRRLLPALATMLVATTLAADLLLSESRNVELRQAGAWAALWASNLYFAFSDTDYFAEEATGNAFLHTWSLGVEEQFYLIWPLLIVIFASTSKGRTAWLATALVSIGIASLIVSMLLTVDKPMLAYYMMPTRAWQFAAGGAVWLLAHRGSMASIQLAMWGGILTLLAGVWLIGPGTHYPGGWALLPTLGTCAVLWAGQLPGVQTLPARWLSLPTMQFIGRLSYALYLWHWPVLILCESVLPVKGQLFGVTAALLISFGLAVATHFLVENPIRYGRMARLRPGIQAGIAMCLMILIGSKLLQAATSSEEVLATQASHAGPAMDIPQIYKDNCDDWYHSDVLKPCLYGAKEPARTAVLIGDSIGAQWFPAVQAMLDPTQWQIIVLTKSSCPMVDEPFFYQRIGREYTECTSWRNSAIDWINQRNVDVIFVGGTASSEFTDRQWREGSARILRRLSRNAGHVYLIEANPVLDFHGPQCLTEHGDAKDPAEFCHSDAGNPRYDRVSHILKGVANSTPKTSWLETASWVCPTGKCEAIRNGVVVFRDNQHLTATFAATAAEHFRRQMPTAGAPQN